jgi:hypothetical protein
MSSIHSSGFRLLVRRRPRRNWIVPAGVSCIFHPLFPLGGGPVRGPGDDLIGEQRTQRKEILHDTGAI